MYSRTHALAFLLFFKLPFNRTFNRNQIVKKFPRRWLPRKSLKSWHVEIFYRIGRRKKRYSCVKCCASKIYVREIIKREYSFIVLLDKRANNCNSCVHTLRWLIRKKILGHASNLFNWLFACNRDWYAAISLPLLAIMSHYVLSDLCQLIVITIDDIWDTSIACITIIEVLHSLK